MSSPVVWLIQSVNAATLVYTWNMDKINISFTCSQMKMTCSGGSRRKGRGTAAAWPPSSRIYNGKSSIIRPLPQKKNHDLGPPITCCHDWGQWESSSRLYSEPNKATWLESGELVRSPLDSSSLNLAKRHDYHLERTRGMKNIPAQCYNLPQGRWDLHIWHRTRRYRRDRIAAPCHHWSGKWEDLQSHPAMKYNVNNIDLRPSSMPQSPSQQRYSHISIIL